MKDGSIPAALGSVAALLALGAVGVLVVAAVVSLSSILTGAID